MRAPALQLGGGAVFADRYRVEGPLAEGGMGIVYVARHVTTQRPVALKVMHRQLVADDELRARFLQEAQVTSAIQSEHLVPIFDAGIDDASGMPYLVMELLRGEDLGRIVARQGPLTPQQTLLYLEQTARGLDKLHGGGVIHRDLKPENLLVTRRDDGAPWLKIIDFGIAKLVSRTADPRTTQINGTPMYMSPEQVLGLGDVGPAADRYALGHIAFDLLVGASYFADEAEALGPSLRFLQQIVDGLPESASARAQRQGKGVPAGFDEWFAQATASDPRRRFGSAREQVGALSLLFERARVPMDSPVDPLGTTQADEGPEPPPPIAAASCGGPHPAPVPTYGNATPPPPSERVTEPRMGGAGGGVVGATATAADAPPAQTLATSGPAPAEPVAAGGGAAQPASDAAMPARRSPVPLGAFVLLAVLLLGSLAGGVGWWLSRDASTAPEPSAPPTVEPPPAPGPESAAPARADPPATTSVSAPSASATPTAATTSAATTAITEPSPPAATQHSRPSRATTRPPSPTPSSKPTAQPSSVLDER